MHISKIRHFENLLPQNERRVTSSSQVSSSRSRGLSNTVALCFLVLFRGIIYSCLSMEVRGALVVWDVTNYLANITLRSRNIAYDNTLESQYQRRV